MSLLRGLIVFPFSFKLFRDFHGLIAGKEGENKTTLARYYNCRIEFHYSRKLILTFLLLSNSTDKVTQPFVLEVRTILSFVPCRVDTIARLLKLYSDGSRCFLTLKCILTKKFAHRTTITQMKPTLL